MNSYFRKQLVAVFVKRLLGGIQMEQSGAGVERNKLSGITPQQAGGEISKSYTFLRGGFTGRGVLVKSGIANILVSPLLFACISGNAPLAKPALQS